MEGWGVGEVGLGALVQVLVRARDVLNVRRQALLLPSDLLVLHIDLNVGLIIGDRLGVYGLGAVIGVELVETVRGLLHTFVNIESDACTF